MEHGFIKVGAGTPAIQVADCAHNADSIVSLICEAAEQGVQLLALPELTLCGYTCGDLLLQDTLLRGVEAALASIAERTQSCDTLVVLGAPLRALSKLYNCAVVLHRGKILGVVPKSHIPNYGEFYEARHFSPAPAENSAINLGGAAVPFGAKLLFSCEGMEDLVVGVEV